MKLTEFLAYLSGEPGWEACGESGVVARGPGGDTPLHAALWAGDDEAAVALLEAGAEVDARGEEGYTPLQVAIARQNADMARFLLERGASLDSTSQLGSSARDDASRSSSPAVRSLVKSATGIEAHFGGATRRRTRA